MFTGKVVVTKGSLVLRGAQLDARQDVQGNQYAVITAEPGKLAFYRQKREPRPGMPDEFMEGEAEVIDYDGKGDIVKFHRRAQMRRYIGTVLNDEMTGVEIVYDNTTSILTVDAGLAKVGPDGGPPRVRTMLTPRLNETRPGSPEAAASAAAAAAPAPVLRRATDLGGIKK